MFEMVHSAKSRVVSTVSAPIKKWRGVKTGPRRAFDGRIILFDFGTSMSFVLIRDTEKMERPELLKRIVRQPTILLRDTRTGEILDFGQVAKNSWACNTAGQDTVFPMRDGKVTSRSYGTEFMKRMYAHALEVNKLRPARKNYVLLPVPAEADETSCNDIIACAREAIKDAEIGLIDDPMASAAGAGLDPTSATGGAIIQIGGGTTDAAIFSLCQTIENGRQTQNIGGMSWNWAIVLKARQQGLEISMPDAEIAKEMVGCAMPAIEPEPKNKRSEPQKKRPRKGGVNGEHAATPVAKAAIEIPQSNAEGVEAAASEDESAQDGTEAIKTEEAGSGESRVVLARPASWRVYGRRIAGSGPNYIDITPQFVFEALDGSLKDMTTAFGVMLGLVPPRQVGMINDKGWRVAGGSALLDRLAERIRRDLNGIPVKIAPDPWECTTLGMEEIMMDKGLYDVMVTKSTKKGWFSI